MPRVKIKTGLIADARDRAKVFARRKKGLLKKADQLAKLCDVDVAVVVCDAGGGGGAPVVWESEPGVVIDRYRRLPADKRATHTHLGYIDVQLSKEEDRLGKMRRQGLNKALACPDEAALEGMDLEELLASIDAALLATDERRKVLGVADDDDGSLQIDQLATDAAAVVPDVGQGRPAFVGGVDELDDDDIQALVDEFMRDDVEPLPLDARMTNGIDGGNAVDTGSNHQWQAQTTMPMTGNGENGHGVFPWHAYQYQPNTTAVSFPDHGFQCPGNNYVDTMGEYSDLLMPSINANAAYESSCEYAIAGNPAYSSMPPQHEHQSMGIGSFMDAAAGGHGHETACMAGYFQCPDAGQRFGDMPEPLHYYLSDMAQGISYYDDLGAGGGSYGGAQFCAQSHSCSGTPQFSGSEKSQSDMEHHEFQDPGVQRFWAMEGPPASTDVVASARARGGLYQPWVSVYQ